MEKEKILIIEDDSGTRNLCGEILRKEGYEVLSCSNGEEGLSFFNRNSLNLVLLDINMPGIDGFNVLERIRDKDRDIPVVAMTGFGTVDNAVKVLKLGASDFIAKPFDLHVFMQTIKKNLEIGNLSKELSKLKMIETILDLNRVIVSLASIDVLLDRVAATVYDIFNLDTVAVYLADEESRSFILRKKRLRNNHDKKLKVSFLSSEVAHIFETGKILVENSSITVPLFGRERKIGFVKMDFPRGRNIGEGEIKFLEAFAIQVSIGMDNASLFTAVKDSYINSISSLVNSLEAKDPYTKGHSEQVAYYAVLAGKQMGLDSKDLEILQNAAYLHDLGKLGIKDAVLLKPGPLEKDEIELIRKHPEITVRILEPLGMRKEELDACYYHHERIDGSGYPLGAKGDAIPLLAKILSVADSYSAMISVRPYRKSLTAMQAVDELKKWSGLQFDADVVNSFVKMLDEQGTI
ncbi:MAG TPA: response regulator [bacterium]|nr:response regulator [bacterium]